MIIRSLVILKEYINFFLNFPYTGLKYVMHVNSTVVPLIHLAVAEPRTYVDTGEVLGFLN